MKWVYGGKNHKLWILIVNICPFQKPPLLLADSLCTFRVTASGLKKCFQKIVACFDAIWETVYFKFIRKTFMSILKKRLRLFLIAINSQHFSNENEFCLWVKGMHLKDFQIDAFF